MKKIGLFYNFATDKTKRCAKKIEESFNSKNFEIVAVDVNETLTEEQFLQFDNIIVGAATWFDGELPFYWDEFVPTIEGMDLSKKRIAVFGLGDQVTASENFCDAMGILGNLFKEQGAKLIGYTETEDYTFEGSDALERNKFMGLALDLENQAKLTDERIKAWVKQLKKEF